MMPLAILGSGMMTSVGLSSPATCAAMRASMSGFAETRFTNKTGKFVIGSQVPLEQPWRGCTKLARLVVPAIQECLRFAGNIKPEAIPLLMCIAEKDRPGRLDGLDEDLMPEVQSLLPHGIHPRSSVISHGRVGVAVALELAGKLIHDEHMPLCLVAGVDSFLVGPTLAWYEAEHRLLTSKNSNGFIPGEAGTAVLLGPVGTTHGPELHCLAIGFGHEPATVGSEKPLRGDGLVEAYQALQRNGNVTLDDTDYRYTDCNGEQYGFKEDRLAFSRTVRKLKARFDHLHPADSIGEVGAAVGPCVLGLALAAARKGYAPGNGKDPSPGKGVLCHFSNDEGERAAIILRYGVKDGAK